MLLVVAIILHNFPEELAVDFVFGAVAAGMPAATIGAAGCGLRIAPSIM
ncbi:MAG: hypothetical protein KAS36_11725 [Anaerolineales bacterium]|nr:hypothetical protein [Anaerolineales bacterium]MCK5314510.1 hypothetical protein [Anaerolineales bacterium]